MIKINIPYFPAKKPPPLFLNFWWSKVWGGGLYDEHKTKTVFFRNQKFGMILEDSAVDFFEEVSEPKEMTDDDSTFSP